MSLAVRLATSSASAAWRASGFGLPLARHCFFIAGEHGAGGGVGGEAFGGAVAEHEHQERSLKTRRGDHGAEVVDGTSTP